MFNQLSVKARLSLLIALMSVVMIMLIGLSMHSLRQSNQGLQAVYSNRTVPLTSIAEIKNRLLHLRTALVTVFPFPEEMASQHKKVDEDIAIIEKLWKEYSATALPTDEKALADKFAELSQPFFASAKKAMILQQASDKAEAEKFYFETVRGTYKPADESINALLKFQSDSVKQEYEVGQSRYQRTLIIVIVASAAGILLSAFFGFLIVRSLLRELGGEPGYAAQVVKEIAAGNLSTQVELSSVDKSSLLYSINSMRETLANIITSTNIVMDEAAKGDLSSRMRVEAHGDFIHLKNSINVSLDTINNTLADVMRVSEALANGDLRQKIDGNYQGVFGQTQQSVNHTVDALSKIIEEIEDIVHSGADCGDFSIKMSLHDKSGYSKRLAELINQLFATTERSLADVIRVSGALAEGDLTQRITNDYPGSFGAVKAGVNVTVENLRDLIERIKDSADVIATAAQEISAGNNDLSHRTEEQAASLEQTAASMDELSSTVQQNTDKARNANELAQGASVTAKKGVEVVNTVVKNMSVINESSQHIVDIISVIDGIAFQTNILALNAAVEAARAGEQGKGFAVVAAEVRNLAQRAASAAGEIKRLISDSAENIVDGSRQVEQAGKTMKEIVNSIQSVTDLMTGIATASLEQNAGISQVHQAITQMDEVTQQNAALVEQAAAAAEALSEQTGNLAAEIAHFKIA
ncbi:MAG: methyl-accepting chemotaxis protein [Methylobacter sp.]